MFDFFFVRFGGVCVWMGRRRVRSMVLTSMLVYDHLGFDDRGVLHCGEQVRKVLRAVISHNSECPNDRWEVPEHFWTIFQESPVCTYCYSLHLSPFPVPFLTSHFLCHIATHLRLPDGVRRFCFKSLEEYLERNDRASPSLFTRETCGLAGSIAARSQNPEGEFMVMVMGPGPSMTIDAIDRMQKQGCMRTSMRKAR